MSLNLNPVTSLFYCTWHHGIFFRGIVNMCATYPNFNSDNLVALSLRLTSHYINSFHFTLPHIISYLITSHHITSYHITTHHITSHHNTTHNFTFLNSFTPTSLTLTHSLGVDILPSELPKDSSEHFGKALSPLLPPLLLSKGSSSPNDLSDLPPELRRY